MSLWVDLTRAPTMSEQSVTDPRKTRSHDVFISYSSKDRERALGIRLLLERHGIRCWMDIGNLRSGAWGLQVAWALAEARQFLLLGSGRSYQSPFVQTELLEAMKRGPDFIHHVVIEAAELPPDMAMHLNWVQRVDAFGPDADEVLESSLVPALAERLAIPEHEIRDAERIRELGQIPSAIIDAIERSGLGACESIFHADLMGADHAGRIHEAFRINERRGDRLVAALDPSTHRDGSAALVLLSTRIAWHLPDASKRLSVDWESVRHARMGKRKFDGRQSIEIVTMDDRTHELVIHCQPEAVSVATVSLINVVAGRVRGGTKGRAS